MHPQSHKARASSCSRGSGCSALRDELEERVTKLDSPKLDKVLTGDLLDATVIAGAIVEAATSAALGGPYDVRGRHVHARLGHCRGQH